MGNAPNCTTIDWLYLVNTSLTDNKIKENQIFNWSFLNLCKKVVKITLDFGQVTSDFGLILFEFWSDSDVLLWSGNEVLWSFKADQNLTSINL